MRYLTAGESHGPKLTVIVDGYPGGVLLDPSFFQHELQRRKTGYGRGGRMKIEADTVAFTAGVRFSETTGAPVAMEIANNDFANWLPVMTPFAQPTGDRRITKPRPGHADLSGALKFARTDIRDILERASARETAARVAAGALSKTLLSCLGIRIFSIVWEIGGKGVGYEKGITALLTGKAQINKYHAAAENNDLRMPLADLRSVYSAIDAAHRRGDSLGGIFSVVVCGVPPGIGSHTQHDCRLDAMLAAHMMSIPAVKAVSIGGGTLASALSGAKFHDALNFTRRRGVTRSTNFAGGIEGGMSNGNDIVCTGFMKPIPTMLTPLASFDLAALTTSKAVYERSDVTAVPACSVVGEAVCAFSIADALMKKFGADSLPEIKRNMDAYCESIATVWKRSS